VGMEATAIERRLVPFLRLQERKSTARGGWRRASPVAGVRAGNKTQQ